MSITFLDQIIEILNRERDLTLATIRSDGYPQTNVVSFVNDGLTLYFGTNVTSQKAINIARNPKVAVSINSAHQDWTEIERASLGGLASKINEPNAYQEVRYQLFSKYPEIAAYAPSTDQEAQLYKIDPVAATLLDYSSGFGFSKTIIVDT